MGEQVPQEAPTDARLVPGSPDHGDGLRFQDGAHGARRRHRLPLLELRDGVLCGRRGDLDRNGTGLRADGDGEACLAEYVDHPVVLGEDLGFQHPDPRFVRSIDQVADQKRSETRPLELVGDAHAELRSGRVLPDELCASHHVPGVAAREREQREVVRILGLDRLGG